jgi:glycerol-3-phosphate acyltransferase PlsY
MEYLITGIVAYLLGSIPTAVWIGKMWLNVDVREHGSKNAGATNSFRVLGKKAGIVVLVIDVSKGILSTVFPLALISLYPSYSESLELLRIEAAVIAIIGHIFPVFAQFRGGKGVATSLGVIIGVQPIAAAICLGSFLIVFILSKYVSLGSICAAILFPVTVFFLEPNSVVNFWFSVVLSAGVIFAHKKNIVRLMNGSENKMNLFKK